jgi:hypothetical protein
MVTPSAVNNVSRGTPRKSAQPSQWRVSLISVSPTSKQTARMGMQEAFAMVNRPAIAEHGRADDIGPAPTA